MQDIENLDDIKRMVDGFYARVREDALLGPIFEARIADRWPAHLEKMYRFWETILLEAHTYGGSPYPPHATLPVDQPHFDTWMALFNDNMDALFAGEKADEAKWRAAKMAALFVSKLRYSREHPHPTLI